MTPGVPSAEYESRRREFMSEFEDDSLVLVESASKKLMTNDIPYRFRQNSDFWYFTGFNEPNSLMALSNRENTKNIQKFYSQKKRKVKGGVVLHHVRSAKDCGKGTMGWNENRRGENEE